MKQKRNIIIVVATIIITIILMMLITWFFLPKDKLKGGYFDVLQANNVEAHIVASNIVTNEDDTASLEIVTTIWNKGNKEIMINEQNFTLNAEHPTNKINVQINKNEKIGIRQLYKYQTINEYNILLQGKKMNFDFRLRAKELQEKFLKLSETKKSEVKTNLEKQQEEAQKVQKEKIQEVEEKNKKLEQTKEAEKLEDTKKQKEDTASEVYELDGVYRSNNIQDDTEISFDPFYTISGKVKNCDNEVIDIQGKYLLKKEENQVFVEIQYPYQQQTIFARFLYKDENTLVNQSDAISCYQGIFKKVK